MKFQSCLVCVVLLGVGVGGHTQDQPYHGGVVGEFVCRGDRNPLVDAVTLRDLERLKRLLASGSAIDELHCESDTALTAASREGQNDMVRTLLDAGADVNKSTPLGWTALMWAAQKGRIETLRLLLARGADVNALNEYWDTALTLAACCGGLTSVQVLLAAGADPGRINAGGWDAFLAAIAGKQTPTVELFLASGADVNAVDRHDNTALMLATHEPASVRVLLAAGAVVDRRAGLLQRTALHMAADGGFVESVRLLIEAGADINARDIDGRTPLSQALSIGLVAPEIARAKRETAALLRAAGGIE